VLVATGGTAKADPFDAYDSRASGATASYLRDAQVYALHGQYSGAIRTLDGVLADHPNSVVARFQRGRALMDSGRYDTAIDDFSRVIASYPEYGDSYFTRGEAYLRAKNVPLAMADFNMAIKVVVGEIIPKRNVGVFSGLDRDFHPRSVWENTLLNANIHSNRGLAYELTGDSTLKLADFKYGMGQVDGNIQGWTMLREKCANAALIDLLDSALAACNDSIDRHPHDFISVGNRGLIYLKKGQWNLAIADYNSALNSNPETSYLLYGRGIAKRAIGDRAGGDADMAAGVRLEPDIANIMARWGVRGVVLARG